MMTLMTKPNIDEFCFPFEGEEHLATIIALPYREDTWEKSGKVAAIAFLELVKIISKYETVFLLKSKKVLYDTKIFEMKNVTIIDVEYDDSWARDNTLIFLKNKDNLLRAVDFGFNAWGGSVDGLYSDYSNDLLLGSNLAKYFGIETYNDHSFILEGGSIHTNGKGLLITTEACLLSKGRNSNLSKEKIEKHLKEMLNIKKVIWLPHGIVNDETNEHVDNMCAFLNENTVLLATSKDKFDLQYKYSQIAKEILENETTIDGKKLKVILVNCPNPYLTLNKDEEKNIKNIDTAKTRQEFDRLAASYVNFYMGKDYVILPKFNVEEDKEAYNILANFYKNKKIYQVDSRSILVAGGNIHCVTMQIPKGVIK